LSKAAITVCAVITVGLGIFPQPLLELADNAARLLH
jgi:NADH-quinone oxidoreductase subunit N